MKKMLFSCAVMASASTMIAGERCVQPNCNAPQPQVCCPPQQQATTQSLTGPVGAYSQGPAVGDFEGESTGFGLRGPEIRFPELRLSLPQLNLPQIVRRKTGARFNAESSVAPFVEGLPAQFGMLSAGGALPVGVQHSLQSSGNADNQSLQKGNQQNLDGQQCTPIPPCPTGASLDRQRLLEELARKDAALNQMEARFDRLEETMARLAQLQAQRPATTSTSSVEQTRYEQPAPVARPSAPPASRPLSAPAPGGQKRSAAVLQQSNTTQAQVSAQPVTDRKASMDARTKTSSRLGEWDVAATGKTQTRSLR